MGSYAVSFLKSHLFEIILSIPKTVYFNFRVLPFRKAIRMPFIVSKNIKLEGVNRDTFVVNETHGSLATASMRIGFGESKNARRESSKGLISIGKNGKIVVGSGLGLSQGCVLIANEARLTLGDNFRCNYSTTIDCYGEDITIGNDVVCGWNVTIRNGDGHRVVVDGESHKAKKKISIGNHVWLCANATVLKGANVGNNSVVAYGSLLTKTEDKENVLYGGTPAKVIRHNINWEE